MAVFRIKYDFATYWIYYTPSYYSKNSLIIVWNFNYDKSNVLLGYKF